MAYTLAHVPANHQPPERPQWPAVDQEVLQTLPPVLRGVVMALGFAGAREFLADRGGTRVLLPMSAQSDVLGLDVPALQRLREVLAPHMNEKGCVWLPKADKLFARARDTQIRRDRHRESISQQALKYRLTVRQIVNIRREDRDDQRQINLF